MTVDVLRLFQPAVAQWFTETFSAPTPPQVLGWPHIAAGENTLILSPTGSGKTLAAFLCAIDSALRHVQESQGQAGEGVHTLYVSPLKALANDIERNLKQPLRGIAERAVALGETLPEIRVGVRTGDTPPNERQKMVRHPPHILITTPESLNLLLTSPRARDMLVAVRYVIVDEIHAVCGNKRGTFLALLLERLETLCRRSPVRIGLSATQRPLSEVALFLGGQEIDGSPRPVAIVDAGMRKAFDLQIQTPVEDMTVLPVQDDHAPSIWPAIYDRLIELVDEHESTLIFANSRRVAERIAAEMNRRIGYESVQAHHGSVSKERRLQIEQALKEGRLPALVATSSMELGIDVGFIDLVCQVESPFSVASGLQRIGRAGHLVRVTSKGRLLPKTRADLLVMAAMSRSMLRGEVSSVSIPRHPLDVLAQQVVAMVSVDDWDVDDLYACIRRAYPYRELPMEGFNSVLEMISGRFKASSLPVLRPRVSWDRVHGQLLPLPGSRQQAILNGGVIPDTGQYSMVLEDGKTRIGELDEEFVFERRLGDTFVLGTGQWRLLEITNDRVIVAPCDASEAMMPFWKGEGLGHDYEFGLRLGAFTRACVKRLADPSLEAWLCRECALDGHGAANLATYMRDQAGDGGVVPTDETVLIDVFRNEAGEERVAVISPYGRSFHLAFLLYLQRSLTQRGCALPESVVSNTGLLLRPGMLEIETLVGAIHSMRSASVEEAITSELENSPAFALSFRRNAGRALLLPRARPGRRTPLWLQRLRAHDLLAYASEQPGFPIVVETYRELLEDVLPLRGLREFLSKVEAGTARFIMRRDRQPSVFSRSMLLDFTARYLYAEDRPVPSDRAVSEIHADLGALIGSRIHAAELLDDESIRMVEERLQATSLSHLARNGAEIVELLLRIGDLTEAELRQRCSVEALDALPDLIKDGRIIRIQIAGATVPERLAAGEEAAIYARLSDRDYQCLVARFVAHHAISRPEALLQRYPVDRAFVERVREAEGWLSIELADGSVGWAHPAVVASIRRMTMGHLRRAVEPASAQAYARHVLERQHVTDPLMPEDLDRVMERLAGCWLGVSVWLDVLSSRVQGYAPELLDEWVRDGALCWRGSCSPRGQRLLTFNFGQDIAGGSAQLPRQSLDAQKQQLLSFLESHGASFLHQIAAGLAQSPATLAPLLWDLIWDGWVTNDSLDAALGDRPSPELWQHHRRGSRWGKGRWCVLPIAAKLTEEHLRRILRRLLLRYGVLSREILHHAKAGITWRDAYPLLTRMEWAGDVERALFISSLSGPQFALAEARRALSGGSTRTAAILVNVNDPANVFGDLFGILRPDGVRHIIRHHPGNYLILADGHPLLAIENRGERLTPLDDLSPSQRAACAACLARLVEGRQRSPSVRVNTWDGNPIADSPIEAELEEAGFVRDGAGMILYRRFD